MTYLRSGCLGPRMQRLQQLARRGGDLIDRHFEALRVGSGRMAIAADFADELQGGFPDLGVLWGGCRGFAIPLCYGT